MVYNAHDWGQADAKSHHLYQTGRTDVLGATHQYKKAQTKRCRAKCQAAKAKKAARKAAKAKAAKQAAAALKKAAAAANHASKVKSAHVGRHPNARL